MKLKSLAIVLLAGAAASCSPQGGSGGAKGYDPNKAVDVGVVTLKAQKEPRFTELTGRVVAKATAEIRPQVDGIVQKVLFKEGGPVKAGDVLYQLDDRKFVAALAAAKATLTKADATEQGAQSTLDRNISLAEKKAVSEQTVQDARTALLQAKADTESARADLQTAQINLDDSALTAPISGVISISNVTIGALVTANQTTALATVRQIDPIQVDLVDTSANLMRTRAEIEKGILGAPEKGAANVTLYLENGQTYGEKGEITVADLNVSETTGTFSLRADFSNKNQVLLPGMFVRAKVGMGVMPTAYLVPQRAVDQNAAGESTAYFATNGKAEQRVISVVGNDGKNWIVASGVKNGEKLIVDGLQKISNGGPVNPVDVTVDENGIVQKSTDGATSGAAKAETAQ